MTDDTKTKFLDRLHHCQVATTQPLYQTGNELQRTQKPSFLVDSTTMGITEKPTQLASLSLFMGTPIEKWDRILASSGLLAL